MYLIEIIDRDGYFRVATSYASLAEAQAVADTFREQLASVAGYIGVRVIDQRHIAAIR
jgi:hypothetical protein